MRWLLPALNIFLAFIACQRKLLFSSNSTKTIITFSKCVWLHLPPLHKTHSFECNRLTHGKLVDSPKYSSYNLNTEFRKRKLVFVRHKMNCYCLTPSRYVEHMLTWGWLAKADKNMSYNIAEPLFWFGDMIFSGNQSILKLLQFRSQRLQYDYI